MPKSTPDYHRPLIYASDIVITLALPLVFLVAWLTPEPVWWGLSRILAVPIRYTMTRRPTRLVRIIRKVSRGHQLSKSPAMIMRRLAASYLLRMFHAAATCFPGPWWQPDIKVEGREHLDEALKAGRGTVLWINNFRYDSSITKIALWRLGYPVHHLALPTHGFSVTRYAVAVLNPLWIRSEDRFIATREVMSFTRPVASLRRFIKRLKQNQIVSLAVRRHSQTPHPVTVLNGRIEVAPGAIELGLATGAAVLPVTSVRTESGGYLVKIAEPLPVLNNAPKNSALQTAFNAYGKSLEKDVCRYPDQWVDWYSVKTDEEA